MKKNWNLKEIDSKIKELAGKIGVPENILPSVGEIFDGHPYIDINPITGNLVYEVKERGQIVKTYRAIDLDDFLYTIFYDLTREMFFLETNKIADKNVDPKRIRLKRQEEHLGSINKDWALRAQEFHKLTIPDFEFNDFEGKKASYLRELLGNGYLYNEAIKLVEAKFKLDK